MKKKFFNPRGKVFSLLVKQAVEESVKGNKMFKPSLFIWPVSRVAQKLLLISKQKHFAGRH